MARFIAFYSYKGGVGRTSALLNAAWLLARTPRRVLIIDADVEAPGLSQHASLGGPTLAPGLVEFAAEYARTGECPPIADHVRQVDGDTRGGELWLMPAGRPDADYPVRLAELDWARLHPTRGVRPFVDGLRESIRAIRPHYVLVDSRTGFSDVGGLTTHLLADQVVLVTNLTRECMDGSARALAAIRRFDPRRERPVLPVANMIPRGLVGPGAQGTIAQRRLSELPERLGVERAAVVEIEYDPDFALIEDLPVDKAPEGPLAVAYATIASRLIASNPRDFDLTAFVRAQAAQLMRRDLPQQNLLVQLEEAAVRLNAAVEDAPERLDELVRFGMVRAQRLGNHRDPREAIEVLRDTWSRVGRASDDELHAVSARTVADLAYETTAIARGRLGRGFDVALDDLASTAEVATGALVAREPDRFKVARYIALVNEGLTSWHNKRSEAAIDAMRRATLLADACLDDPLLYSRLDVIWAFTNLCVFLGEDRQFEASVEAGARAVALARAFVRDDPSQVAILTEALNNLASSEGACGRRAEALLHLDEALALCEVHIPPGPTRDRQVGLLHSTQSEILATASHTDQSPV